MKLVVRALAWWGVRRRDVSLDARLRPYRAGGALPDALRHGTLLLQERLRPYRPAPGLPSASWSPFPGDRPYANGTPR